MKLEGPIFFGSPGDSRACSAMALPAETREANQQQGYYKNGCGWLLYALRPLSKGPYPYRASPRNGAVELQMLVFRIVYILFLLCNRSVGTPVVAVVRAACWTGQRITPLPRTLLYLLSFSLSVDVAISPLQKKSAPR